MTAYEPISGHLATLTIAALVLTEIELMFR